MKYAIFFCLAMLLAACDTSMTGEAEIIHEYGDVCILKKSTDLLICIDYLNVFNSQDLRDACGSTVQDSFSSYGADSSRFEEAEELAMFSSCQFATDYVGVCHHSDREVTYFEETWTVQPAEDHCSDQNGTWELYVPSPSPQ